VAPEFSDNLNNVSPGNTVCGTQPAGTKPQPASAMTATAVASAGNSSPSAGVDEALAGGVPIGVLVGINLVGGIGVLVWAKATIVDLIGAGKPA